MPLAGIFPLASSHAIIPSCTCPPCGHLPPGIFPLARIFPRASSPLRASSPGHLPPPSYPLPPAPPSHLPPGIFPHHHTLLHLPLARIFPRASSHAIIPSYFCATFTMILW